MTTFGNYTNGFDFDWEDMKRFYRATDGLGFDMAWTMDNSVWAIPGQPDHPTYEPWVILSALAEITTQVKIGPLVTPCIRRHPSVLAKMASVLDVVSGGRLILGRGISDLPQLFEPWGFGFPKPSERTAILREELQVVRSLWTQDRTTFHGEYFQLEDAICNPKPLQQPGPPVWIGISDSRRLLPILSAEYADGIQMSVPNDEVYRERLGDIADACRQVGRDYDELIKSRKIYLTITDEPNYDIRERLPLHAAQIGKEDLLAAYWYMEDGYHTRLVGNVDQVGEGLERMVKQGTDDFVLQFFAPDAPMGGDIDAVIGSMEIFANEVMPSFH